MYRKRSVITGALILSVFIVCWVMATSVQASWPYETKLLASDGTANDQLGRGVGFDTGASYAWVIVGAPVENAAYVYKRDLGTGVWTEDAKLTVGGLVAGDQFGADVGISAGGPEDFAVVGAAGKNSSTGAAYVFWRSPGGWVLQATLNGTSTGDLFGGAVAISGQTIVVGANENDDQATNAGAAYTYEAPGPWALTDVLYDNTPGFTERFGLSVAIDAIWDRLVVGVRDGSPTNSGAACVFSRSGTNWTFEAKLRAPSPCFNCGFGDAVSITGDGVNGNYAAVGEPNRPAGLYKGAAYVFNQPPAGSWSHQQTLDMYGATDDLFGASVAIRATNLVIGAPTRFGATPGAVYAFSRTGATWTVSPDSPIPPNSGANGDYFGQSVAISNPWFVAGAYGDDDNGEAAGAAYVHEFDLLGPGACCVGASCSVLNEVDCINAGGTYIGEGVSCDPDPCVVAPPVPALELHEMPHQEVLEQPSRPVLTSAAVDTFVLGTFDFGLGTAQNPCDPQGWISVDYSGRGDFAQLYPGIQVLQEDICLFDRGCVWGFFDVNEPYNCHIPNPQPTVGSVPYVSAGLYTANETWSPWLPNLGSGYEYRLRFLAYRDLPLDNLVFYVWRVRSWSSGAPGPWRDRDMVYYGSGKDWIRVDHTIGDLIDPAADSIQVALGVWDMCAAWCGLYGSGTCHSHAPLFDEARVLRVDISVPQYGVRHIDLFQDNFSEDGTLIGTARADAAIDILPPANPAILPGDSVTIAVSPVQDHAGPGSGPAVYLYANVDNRGPGKPVLTGAQMQSSDTRPAIGARFPLVGTFTDMGGTTWQQFQMDTVFTSAGAALEDRYCVDLNDALFVPGDTIRYYFGAVAPGGARSYFSRTLNGQGAGTVFQDIEEVASTPMEFTILPAGGYNRGGDILMVDDADDRGGPAQLYFDSALELFGELELVDRYDVLGPSSGAGNSLASRVASTSQIIIPYRKIIWNSGNLSSATLGDGSGDPEKSDDYCLLLSFLDTHPNNPGLYLSGDDIAQEWANSLALCATELRALYMNFNVLGGDHNDAGEAVAPCITASPTSTIFAHAGVPDQLVAYGGCLPTNDFDVLEAQGLSVVEYPWPSISGGAAVISQTMTNSVATTARVVMSGFAYNYIRACVDEFPNPRTEFLRDILLFLQNTVGEPTGIDPGGPQYVNSLDNNYPNPFNPVTTIKYSIKERAQVSLKIYNAAGQLVKILIDEVQSPDRVAPVSWDGRNDAGQIVSSGVYFYKLVTKNFSKTKKMVYLK